MNEGVEEQPLLAWDQLSGREIDALDRERTVILVACSPLEVHGPHLPTVTDSLESQALGERAARRMQSRFAEIVFVTLPPIYVATDVVPQVGSVRFRPSTLIRVLTDLGRSLTKQGFKRIWVSNFHGGPRHFLAIEQASHRVNRRFGGQMLSLFSLLLKRLTGGNTDLSDVFGSLPGIDTRQLRGDSHAGAVETSMMLHLLADRVDPAFRRLARMTIDRWATGRDVDPAPLPRNPIALFNIFKHKLKYFETESYSGHPAVASAEAGEQIIDVLSEHASEALAQIWTGELSADECHSPIWPVRWLFLSETVAWLFERSVRYRTRVF